MATDLLFKGTPLTSPPINLTFGAEDTGGEGDTRTLNIAGKLPQLRGSGVLSLVRTMTVEGRLPGLHSAGALIYASRTSRPTVGEVQQKFQQAVPTSEQVQDRYQQAVRITLPTDQRFQDADPVRVFAQDRWQDARRTRRSTTQRYQDGVPVRREVSSRWQTGILVRNARTTRYQDGLPMFDARGIRFQQGLKRRNWVGQHYRHAVRMNAGWQETEGYAVPFRWGRGSRYQDAIRPPPGMYVPPGPQPEDPCYVPPPANAVELLFSRGPGTPALLLFSCETHGEEPPTETVYVPIKRVYIVLNDVWLKRFDTGDLIPTESMSLSIDVDSWTYSFSATCPKHALSVLDPTADAGSQEVVMSINGRSHRLRIESISTDRRFANTSVRLQGRGRNAELDQPYSPIQNFGNTDMRTANQLMEDVLTLSGIPLGWTVNWGLEDWNVPAGAFSHQGTYQSAINAIAAAAGGYVHPHPSDKELFVRPRYPAAPWQWATLATPDFSLPAAVVTNEGIEWQDKPNYERVWVSGQNVGVLGRVTRPGVAGDVLAPMVTDALITDAVAARQRGMAVLSDIGKQALVTLRLPVLGSTNIITPGKFVEYVDGAVERLGVVRAVSVDVAYPSVSQRIIVETHLGL